MGNAFKEVFWNVAVKQELKFSPSQLEEYVDGKRTEN